MKQLISHFYIIYNLVNEKIYKLKLQKAFRTTYAKWSLQGVEQLKIAYMQKRKADIE